MQGLGRICKRSNQSWQKALQANPTTTARLRLRPVSRLPGSGAEAANVSSSRSHEVRTGTFSVVTLGPLGTGTKPQDVCGRHTAAICMDRGLKGCASCCLREHAEQSSHTKGRVTPGACEPRGPQERLSHPRKPGVTAWPSGMALTVAPRSKGAVCSRTGVDPAEEQPPRCHVPASGSRRS